ncbi:MAG: UPF0182 family protein [Bryobacteraceae bacterium]|jgi:uncharacterized membrane protein (UPF0182 family)
MVSKQLPAPPRGSRGCISLVAAVVVLFVAIRFAASWVIDFEWWTEMGQVQTWFAMLLYGFVPSVLATIIAFLVFWIAHVRALRFAGASLRGHRLYAWISTAVLFVLALIVATASIDSWVAVRYFGGRGLASDAAAWRDPAFGHPLSFYFFELPFYKDLLVLLLAISIAAMAIYWITARAWQLRRDMPGDLREISVGFDLRSLHLAGALESFFLRAIIVLALLGLGVNFLLHRYDLLLADHGFMSGMDYVDQNITLPLTWLLAGSCLLAAIAVSIRRPRYALIVVVALILRAILPPIVGSVYVRPNEISLERPFIERHIQATRAAFTLDQRTKEVDFQAKPEQRIDLSAHKALLDNVRLWDWHAFHETVSQMQPLRPYVYSDTDVDRYTLDGQFRQVLVSPRELDLRALGDAQNSWIATHFMYTHGYGIVMAEANRITPTGLPILFIKDAPPVVTVPELKFTRPEIYYGEDVHDPVFVHTAQEEFNYPSGSSNVLVQYAGTGGFPISAVWLRTLAAVARSDWNILLTSNLTPDSRMMIHRNVRERLSELAGFVSWDTDPYIVLTDSGRLTWIVDGYMTSDAHPYSQEISSDNLGTFNYIRNSVKATIDAYDGTVKLYVFDEQDPLLAAYRRLFPNLFTPASAMPADLRRHVRYPEMIFQAEAEVYRMFHMRDAETFYNKSDAWDIAKYTSGQNSEAVPLTPTYVIATLPGETQPEFLLMIPFTPRNRPNLTGLLMARCDGAHLGEKVILVLSKQETILGPMLVEARIDQDQNISKDLTLWNQQGSHVLRGQMLVLPIENTFLYIEPIYIQGQSSEASMPQLKKIALAMGNTLVYTDTWQQALDQLAADMGTAAPQEQTPPAGSAPVSQMINTPGQPLQRNDPRLTEIRQHLQRYRDLTSQGKLSEAGKELEAIQGILGK